MRGELTRRSPAALGIAGLILVGWFGCSGDGGRITDPDPLAQEPVVSDPLSSALPSLVAGTDPFSLEIAQQTAGGSDVAYIALPPGTVSNGRSAIITSDQVEDTLKVTIVDGGFDPIPFSAAAGDVVQIRVLAASGDQLVLLSITVPARRKPRVIRTVPPRNKTDVPLNQSVVIVFSEPVAPASLSASSVQLIRGTSQVPGRLELIDGAGLAAVFVPFATLQANVEYRLRINQSVVDLDGDPLESTVTSTFRTGSDTLQAPSFVRISPDTVHLNGVQLPATYQLTATVHDARGDVLTDQPVFWSSSDPGKLTVSPAGRLTALASGTFSVSARAANLPPATAMVFVTGAPASAEVSPSPASVPAEESIALAATLRDASGEVVPAKVTWTSSAPDIATLSSVPGAMAATVTGVREGSAIIRASAGEASGTTTVTVTPRRSTASVSVTPEAATIVIDGMKPLVATTRDASGKVIPGRAVVWATDNTAVATINALGEISAIGPGTVRATATSDGVSGSATITVIALRFVAISATYGHSCGLTAEGSAYCWGRFTTRDDGEQGPSLIPAAVPGGHVFKSITAGMTHSCGVTTGGEAYCWGYGDAGQLGDGTGEHHFTPARVTGGLTFESIVAGGPHTCALTTEDRAFCWGLNQWGQIGDGTPTQFPDVQLRRHAPTPVSGNHRFAALDAGASDHSCGLATGGSVFCWGRGDFGKLGNGSTAHSSVPVRVGTAETFASIASGWHQACALNLEGIAYCWGLAAPPIGQQLSPRPIDTNLRFSALAAGSSHVCGITGDGVLYCWGFNEEGRLGDGTTQTRSTPTLVTGGHTFSAVTGGGAHSCALTTQGIAYCWGLNNEGQLGNGTTTNSTVPVEVAGQR